VYFVIVKDIGMLQVSYLFHDKDYRRVIKMSCSSLM